MFGSTPEEHERIFKQADVNADGIITISDATAILTYYAMSAASLNPSWDNILNI